MNKKLFKITKNLKESSGYSTGISIKKAKKNLITIRQILITNKKKIIQAICLDVKKTLVDAKNEFNGSIKIWNFAINNFHLVKRQKKIYFSNKKKGIINYEPIGVVAFITPWNYPLLTLSERLPFCIACGCAAVLKPSEFTPNFSEILKKIIDSNYKLNKYLKVLKNSGVKIGKDLCKDPNISLISFVGSTKTGKQILKQCAQTIKKTNLELGGKNPAIICQSANINLAISKVINGIFENGGQACVAISRVLIDEKIYDDTIKKMIIKVKRLYQRKKLKIQIPAINSQRKKVISLINYIKSNYPKNIIKIFNLGSKKFTPIFMKTKSRKNFLITKEFFFPVVSFEKFKNLAECISIGNLSGYGLATYIFSSNNLETKYLVNQLQFGRIWVNSSLEWSPALPVGGFKMSGQGRDMGIIGFKTYLTNKSLYIEK